MGHTCSVMLSTEQGGEGGGEGGSSVVEPEEQPVKEEVEDDVGKPPDYKTQKEEIYPLLSQRLKKGDYW